MMLLQTYFHDMFFTQCFFHSMFLHAVSLFMPGRLNAMFLHAMISVIICLVA